MRTHHAVTANLLRAATWGQEHDRHVFIGEFGAHIRGDAAARIRWTRWVRREAERLGIGWCYWAYGTEFRIHDDHGESWNQPLLAALTAGPTGNRSVQPECR